MSQASMNPTSYAESHVESSYNVTFHPGVSDERGVTTLAAVHAKLTALEQGAQDRMPIYSHRVGPMLEHSLLGGGTLPMGWYYSKLTPRPNVEKTVHKERAWRREWVDVSSGSLFRLG